MKHTKKTRIFSLLLCCLMLVGILPLGQVAYAEGEISVTATYDSATHSAACSWSPVTGAVRYAVYLLNYDVSDNTWRQANGTSARTTSETNFTIPASCFQYTNYGSSDYKVCVYANDNNDNDIAKGCSDAFHTDYIALNTPTVIICPSHRRSV